MQLEPVDARADLDLERPRLPVELAVGLDVPALLDELAHRARQVSRGQVECLARPVALVHGALAEARLPEARRGLPLGARVPSEEAAALRLEDARAVAIHADDGPVVVEAERRAQPLRAPVAGRRADPKAGPRRCGDLLVLELVGELEAGQARKPEERVEERASLRQRDAHRAVAAQVGEPRKRAGVVEPRHALSREDQAPREEQPHRGQLDPLGAPAERSGDDVVPGLRIGAHVERRGESRAVVPAEVHEVRVRGRRAQPRAPRSAEERHQAAVEVRRDEVAMAHGAVARVAVEPQAIRIAGAAEQGQDLAVRRLRERGELGAPEAESAELGEAAALARIAGEHLEDERALGNRRRGVDHVEDLSARRPVGRGVLPRGVHRMPQGSQVLLPRQWPGAGPERAGKRQPGLGIAVPVVLRVDVDPVALALDRIAGVAGTGPIAVEAQEVREAVSSSHERRSGDIVESYPIATTATNGPGSTVPRWPAPTGVEACRSARRRMPSTARIRSGACVRRAPSCLLGG